MIAKLADARQGSMRKIQMTKFFGISHDVDRLDLATLYFERGGLWDPVILACHKPWQTIDQAFVQEWGQLIRGPARNIAKKQADICHRVDRRGCCNAANQAARRDYVSFPSLGLRFNDDEC